MAVNPSTKVLQEVEEPGKEPVRGESFTDSPFTGEEEVEEGRAPRTRECPEGMNAEELRMHSLTHIPYHPGCKCCVAGRKRDHKHPRRHIGHAKMQADLEEANGASICADYFFPRDSPGKDGVTAIAICDFQSQFLAGHVVDSKGPAPTMLLNKSYVISEQWGTMAMSRSEWTRSQLCPISSGQLVEQEGLPARF